MATITPKQLFQARATTAYVTKYTVPGSTTTIVRSINITNAYGAAVLLYLHIVPSGGAADATNPLYWAKGIAANGNLQLETEIVMATGDFISIKASITLKLVILVNGVEIT